MNTKIKGKLTAFATSASLIVLNVSTVLADELPENFVQEEEVAGTFSPFVSSFMMIMKYAAPFGAMIGLAIVLFGAFKNKNDSDVVGTIFKCIGIIFIALIVYYLDAILRMFGFQI